MKFKSLLNLLVENEHAPGLKKISLQEALNRKMFGPVYHGTTQNNLNLIKINGFKIIKTEYDGKRHGYDDFEYYAGIPAPIHHLGFGVYFTTSKTIARQFNGDFNRGLIPFYIDVESGKGMEIINFASQRTMMEWWKKNNYNPIIAQYDRFRATEIMTETLKDKNDAVWFKGKGGFKFKLLDGDQVCVYDTSKIYMIDTSLSDGKLEVGAKVKRKSDGMIGTIYEIVKRNDHTKKVYEDLSEEEWEDRRERLTEFFDKEHADQKINEQKEFIKNASIAQKIDGDNFQTYRIKWNKGGKGLREYFSIEIDPYIKGLNKL